MAAAGGYTQSTQLIQVVQEPTPEGDSVTDGQCAVQAVLRLSGKTCLGIQQRRVLFNKKKKKKKKKKKGEHMSTTPPRAEKQKKPINKKNTKPNKEKKKKKKKKKKGEPIIPTPPSAEDLI